MQNLLSCLIVPVIMACTFPAFAADTLIEAEANPTAGDLKIIEDATASGGKAVSLPRDWNPLIKAKLPDGEAFSIWIRYRNGQVQLKGTPGGQQKELKWLYDKSAQLEWKNFGRFKREQLGEEIIVIRGGGGGQGPIVDALFISTDDKAQPPSASSPQARNVAAPTNPAVPVDAALALGALDAPPGTLIEAESGAAGEIVNDTAASGGKVVRRNGDWQPVISLPVPAGEAFKIWVRHKGGPFAIKANVDGKMQDNWRWANPEKYQWTDAGVYAREALGEKLTIIRNNDAKNSLVIDSVVFAPDKIRILPPFEPDAKLAAVKINASIDWSKSIGTITRLHWGTNDYEITKPEAAADPVFQQLLGEQKFAIIRIHNSGMSDAWTNATTRTWDVEKIKSGFTSSTGYGDAKIMMNIARRPGWLSPNEVLTPAEEDQYAALVGQLVRVMRDDVKRPVAYWELTNEREGPYEKEGKLNDLWRLFNKLAAAVRKEDPNAKIGGPAFSWPKPEWLEGFLLNCGQNIDFLTWHNYATGDIYDGNEIVLARPESIGNMARVAVEAARKHVPNKPIETFLTELNVKWTWDPLERRHGNNVGAIFLANTVKNVALSGATGITHWHAKGNSYGMISGSNQVLPPAYLYRWGNQYLHGNIAPSQSDDTKILELFPVQRPDGSRALLLMNKSPRTVVVPGLQMLMPNAQTAWRIDAETTKNPANGPATVEVKNDEISLSGYSLTLITTREK